MDKDFIKKLLAGSFFLLLYIALLLPTWILMQAFGYVLKLKNWANKGLIWSLNMEGLFPDDKE